MVILELRGLRGSRSFDAEEFGQFAENAVALLWGEVVMDGVDRRLEYIDDLIEGVAIGGLAGVVEGEFSFEEPAGGAPVAAGLCGVADGLDEVGFEVGFGLGDLLCKLGIASQGVPDRGRRTADRFCGSAAAAAGGEEGEDAFALLGAEGGWATDFWDGG